MATGTTILSSLFIWIILLGLTALIFFVIFTLLLQYRKNSLKKVEESIMESKLKIGPETFGKMNATITSIWNTRADVHPIPELNHLAKGWIKNEEGEFLCIREEIIKSFSVLQNKACSYNPTYVRKPSMCAQTYLLWLAKQRGINFNEDDIYNYVFYFNKARYGPTSEFFVDEEYAIFLKSYHALIEKIPTAIKQFSSRAAIFVPNSNKNSPN